MSPQAPRRIAIASGYFNPLHVGHVRMLVEARSMADHLVVIVNNDAQQQAKIGRVIMPAEHRLEIVAALAPVTEAVEAVDADGTVNETLAGLRRRFPSERLMFVEGGDRDRSDLDTVPEVETCQRLGIELVLGVGGRDKADASSRINRLLDELA